MSRIARVVVPGIAHHVTQRGNRCWRVFFSDADYAGPFSKLLAGEPVATPRRTVAGSVQRALRGVATALAPQGEELRVCRVALCGVGCAKRQCDRL